MQATGANTVFPLTNVSSCVFDKVNYLVFPLFELVRKQPSSSDSHNLPSYQILEWLELHKDEPVVSVGIR